MIVGYKPIKILSGILFQVYSKKIFSDCHIFWIPVTNIINNKQISGMEKDLEAIFLTTVEANKDRMFRICRSYSVDADDAKDFFQ